MYLGLKDKVVIVTGAAQGIGKAIALAFAEEEAKVVVNDVDSGGVKQLIVQIKALGSNCLPVIANVANRVEVDQMIERVLKNFGQIDILVNNAGVLRRGFVEEMKEQDWDEVMDVNLKGVFHCCQAVIPLMKKQKKGKIINSASIIAKIPDIGMAAYAVSKAGVVTFTKVLAAELAPYNVNVNAYVPGVIETPMTRDLIEKRGEEKLRYISLRRFGKPRDVANVVLFLASDVSDYITGALIDVTGGNLIVQRPWEAWKK